MFLWIFNNSLWIRKYDHNIVCKHKVSIVTKRIRVQCDDCCVEELHSLSPPLSIEYVFSVDPVHILGVILLRDLEQLDENMDTLSKAFSLRTYGFPYQSLHVAATASGLL